MDNQRSPEIAQGQNTIIDSAETTAAEKSAPVSEASSLPPETQKAGHETITLYHGSPATFSGIDSEKIGLGQNLVGKGFYTDTSVLGVHYVMEEINHQDYYVYELEIPSDSVILDRWDNSTFTDAIRERIREAGKGDISRSETGNKLAASEKIDDTFLMLASSPQGISILKEAGIAALKDNSYIAIVNTDLIENIRLRSARGNIKAEMTQYIDKALDNIAQDSSRLSDILNKEPGLSKHYDAIRSELINLAMAQNRPDEAERLTSLLTHTFVETIDSNPDRKTNIIPLNRLYAETIRSLDLNHDNNAATLGRIIDSVVVNVSPHQEVVAEPVPELTPPADTPRQTESQPTPSPVMTTAMASTVGSVSPEVRAAAAEENGKKNAPAVVKKTSPTKLNPGQTRTYLAVPHSEKDEARKAAGKLEDNKPALRFDDERKVWYALPGANMEALKRWKPDPLLTGVSAGDALTQFTDFLLANGADVPDKVVMDGTRQRIRMRDDKPGRKSCTYVGHLDGLPNGWFNDFRDGGKDELSTWYFSGEEGDPVASLHMKAVTAQSQWDRVEAKRVLQDKKAGNVRYVHGKFGQAGHQHPYLVKKGVQAAKGVHIDDKQRLLIPLQNVDGVIRSMQTIDPEGNKRLTKDAEKSGNFFVVGGTLKNGRPIICAEGYATAASGAMALRMPVVMAIDSGNLVKVAERLHQKYPDSPMLFLGDDDPPKPHRPGNPGKEAAEKAAKITGGTAILPALTQAEREQGLTDFNDLHQSRGLAALTEELAPWRQKLLSALTAGTETAPLPGQPTETVIMNDQDSVNNNMNNAPTSQGEVDNQQAQAQTQADFEEWVASSQDAPPAPPTPPSPATSASTAPAASASASASAETATATSASGPATENTDVPPKKVRRTRKATPAASGEDKGKTKPAAAAPAARKPRKKKTTPEVVQEKPEQAIPTTSAAAAVASGTTSNSTAAAPAGTAGQEAPVSISSLLTQESPPYVPEPATGAGATVNASASAVVDADEEEMSPAPAPTLTTAPASTSTSTSVPNQNLKKSSATSGENVQAQTEDNDAPESSSTPSTPSTPEPDGIKFERSRQIRERIDLVALEGSLLHKPGNERGTLQYLLDGERAFTRYMQQGRIIMATPQASQNDRMILGALLVAKQDMVLQGNIELTGSPAFKQRAINLIAEYDLPLKLTNEEQIKMLEAAREKLRSEPPLPDEPTPLGGEASEILVHPGQNNTPSPQASSPVPAGSTQRASTGTLPPDILPQKAPSAVPMNASHDEATAGLTGTLLEHGPAPYNFKKGESNSYYARLRTAEGERIVWGTELRSAIADAGLKNNDLVTLQMLGRTAVTVDVRQKDKDGNLLLDADGNVITRKEERERNNWAARQAIDPTVVSTDTRNMTPPGEMLAYSLKAWHDLQAEVVELAKKAEVSLPDWPNLPDALWMEPNGKGILTPDRQPDRPDIPSPSRNAGKALFQAMDAEGQLKLLLVKAHGDFVQGVVLHEDSYKPVLGKLCKNANGGRYMTLNEITADGLRPLGYGNPINSETGNFNNYVFRLNNEPHRLYAEGVEPEKRTAALQQQLGFVRAPVAPDQLVVNREPKATHRHAPSTPRPGH